VDHAGSGLVRTVTDLGICGQQGVQEKNPEEFSGELSTEIFTGRIGLPVENWCRIAAGRGLFLIFRTGPWRLPSLRWPVDGSRTADRLRPARRFGYPSRVCSITGAAIDRIAEAIDQLASDARGQSGESRPGELAARVAELWLMVSALDPELARRKERYTKPADGAPSS
jgi:hypothetical protein